MAEASQFAKSLRSPMQWVAVSLVLLFIAGVVLGPFGERSNSIRERRSPDLQNAHAIGLAMYAYANDNHGAYPSGNSSTEVFQKLIDEGYLTDGSILYVEDMGLKGKVKASSKKLKPENVCWDVTAPLDSDSSDALPVVFLTGYRVEYMPNGKATRLPGGETPGMAVFYHSNSACFKVDDGQADHVVLNFISSDFKPDGKKYVQLTPDGPLGP